MARLVDDQARIMDVLQRGPAAFPGGLFAGPDERTLLGLKAHANTISHARLVALEESFPRTRDHLGAEAFNRLSRQYIELPVATEQTLALIGAGFAAFLHDQACTDSTVDLARIEWAWLESYHAADAPALTMADLAGLDEQALLGLSLTCHPAVRAVKIHADLAAELPELASQASTAAWVLITRPEADVMLHGLDHDTADIFALLQNSDLMRNLLASAIELRGEANALPCIFTLIGAGVLVRPDI